MNQSHRSSKIPFHAAAFTPHSPSMPALPPFLLRSTARRPTRGRAASKATAEEPQPLLAIDKLPAQSAHAAQDPCSQPILVPPITNTTLQEPTRTSGAGRVGQG